MPPDGEDGSMIVWRARELYRPCLAWGSPWIVHDVLQLYCFMFMFAFMFMVLRVALGEEVHAYVTDCDTNCIVILFLDLCRTGYNRT